MGCISSNLTDAMIENAVLKVKLDATKKAATEKAATEKAATEKAAAEKAATEKAATEKAATTLDDVTHLQECLVNAMAALEKADVTRLQECLANAMTALEKADDDDDKTTTERRSIRCTKCKKYFLTDHSMRQHFQAAHNTNTESRHRHISPAKSTPAVFRDATAQTPSTPYEFTVWNLERMKVGPKHKEVDIFTEWGEEDYPEPSSPSS
jgi:hypothetical protein